MLIFENIKMAIESIKINRMRSFLTMLGIIIGIASVIVIIAAGDGAKDMMMSSAQDIGSTTLQVTVNSDNADVGDGIKLEDAIAIKELAGVAAVSPIGQTFGRIEYGRHEKFAMINGTSEDMESINQIDVVTGRFFSNEDYLAGRKVVVIDDATARNFFGTTDVVGMSMSLTIRGKVMKAKIVGVSVNPYSSYGLDMEGLPGVVYLPFTTLNEFEGGNSSISTLYIKTETELQKEVVSTNAMNLLDARHNTRGRNVFMVTDMMQQVNMISDMISMIQTFVAAVAAISLLVGGVGVMNIMLVSVSERTREIGIRKALGAKTGAILQQFLTESAILSLIGGAIGLTIGYFGAVLVCSIVNVSPVFSFNSIIVTLVFSAAVGLFFGIYPARQAAKMNPIEALRHE